MDPSKLPYPCLLHLVHELYALHAGVQMVAGADVAGQAGLWAAALEQRFGAPMDEVLEQRPTVDSIPAVLALLWSKIGESDSSLAR
jgi:hypothetical protein